MEAFSKILLLLLSINVALARVSPDLLLNISDGSILGRYMTSETGKTIRAFIGIPFAEPPINDLRFRAPKKIEPWNGIRKVQEEAPKCLQYNLNKFAEGQEDCLYLNVYAPGVHDSQKFSVMVFFHGGGLITGHGGYTAYGPDYILEHDIILVTGNYRLGAIGFLSTEDDHIPGNFGLKDQVQVLKWVQENIEHFNGDKNSVSIFGESVSI
jgi:carboxylesterase type B